jgi:hypothetical protein
MLKELFGHILELKPCHSIFKTTELSQYINGNNAHNALSSQELVPNMVTYYRIYY